jgi:hypothetical protein
MIAARSRERDPGAGSREPGSIATTTVQQMTGFRGKQTGASEFPPRRAVPFKFGRDLDN